MKLTMLYKDSNSGGQGCPSVYLADSGEMVVQGVQLDADAMGELANLLPGETAIRIDPEIIMGAVRRYQANR
ncbi:hypothetical protein [Streptosporangium sp. NPDC006007]|uniref:hypothetical protein n=1 Tax=Streptosporangium sp. NPDC006007 TaxID=3154575 RepID=UPI0033A879DC